MPVTRLPLNLESLNKLLDRAIYSDFHNIVIIWGELGKGKTSLMMQILYRVYKDWAKVVSFIFEPHVCVICGHEFNADQRYTFEVPCEKCNTATKTKNLDEAIQAVRKRLLVQPFPFDLRTGLLKKWESGTVFTINTGKARGRIVQQHPYMNFSFAEIRNTLENAVETRMKLAEVGWDDVAVYFHRSNIQYMHPDVKNFFSRYNFIRKYCGNLLMTVPTIAFVPLQLIPFCTADILLSNRGLGDFDVKKEVRSFFGKNQTWTKNYDGRDVTWEKVPDKWFDAYEEVRHAHAVEAFEKPEEIFVTTMPKAGKEFTEEESLLD